MYDDCLIIIITIGALWALIVALWACNHVRFAMSPKINFMIVPNPGHAALVLKLRNLSLMHEPLMRHREKKSSRLMAFGQLMYVVFFLMRNIKFDVYSKNAFMTVSWSDPHETLSYDRMHNDSHGVGGKHILPIVLRYLKASGRDMLAELDKRSGFIISFSLKLNKRFIFFRFNDMPAWRGLTHFDQVVSIDFTDATKLEHIVKVSSHNTNNMIIFESESS
jgi:hypothetical protein